MPKQKTKKTVNKTSKSTNSKSATVKKSTKKSSAEKVIQQTKPPLSNVFKLSEKSLRVILYNWKVFSLVSLLYFFLTLLFVRGFSSAVNVVRVKNSYLGSGHGHSAIGSDFSAFGNVIGGSLSNSGNGNVYQPFLFVVFSLVFIWMLRELLKNNKISFSSSLYKSQYPFIQFIIVLFFLTLELIPLIIGLFLYATVFDNGIAVHVIEKVSWILVVVLLVALSLYFLIASVFALYIVTLPDVRPMQALKSSWRLVKGRRVTVFRKLLFLPIALIIVIGIISLLFIAVIPQAADYVFFVLSVISLAIVHSYLYNLYRELI